MLRAGELAVDAGRGDLQGIFLRNGVFAVQHGLMAWVRSTQSSMPTPPSLSIKMRRYQSAPSFVNVTSQIMSKLLCERLCQRAHDLRGAAFLFLCHTQLPFSARFSAAVSVLDIHPNTNKRAGRPTLSSSYYLTVKIIPQRRFFARRKTKFSAQIRVCFYVLARHFSQAVCPCRAKTTSVRFISRKTQKRTRRLFAVTSVVCAYFIPLRIQARRSRSLPHRPLRAYSAR